MVGWCEMLIEACLWVRYASASGKGVVSILWLWSRLSFWSRAFVIVVISRPSGAWRRALLGLFGWCVISYAPVGIASRSGLIGFVVYVVCSGCHPPGRFGGAGGVVRVFLRVGAFVVLYLSIVAFPLGVVSTVVSFTQVGFQVTLNGMESMGVSSSSELSRLRCAVVRPSILCWQNCLAVRCSDRHLLTWYIVWWRRCLCASISIVSRGLSAVWCGSGRSVGMGGVGRFRVLDVVGDAVLFVVVALVSVA